jgi:hypothetical protein
MTPKGGLSLKTQPPLSFLGTNEVSDAAIPPVN